MIDHGIALWFPAPHSLTGEDVLELQGHGGPVVLDRLLESVLSRAAVRPARAGEFSERAFLNGKIDLLQAEAIADLIDAATTEAARSSIRSLQGDFSRAIHQLVESLTELRVYIEATIDFPEEEIDSLSSGRVAQQLQQLQQQLRTIDAAAQQGQRLREGMSIVLAGQPNAGKSSLLNTLSGGEHAIVTDIAGTTRDIVRQEIQIDGMPLRIIDTAGLRESDDPIEQEGMRRSWEAIKSSDRTLLLIDSQQGLTPADRAILAQLPHSVGTTLVYNKIDLVTSLPTAEPGYPALYLSARHGDGVETLRSHLKQVMGFQGDSEGVFMARRRHLEALSQSQRHLIAATEELHHQAAELVAEELRQAQHHLGTITGAVTADDLLGDIFSAFCIGK